VAERRDRAPAFTAGDRDVVHPFLQSYARRLTATDRNALLPHLKVVELPQELVLFDAGDPIKAVYFPIWASFPWWWI